MGIKAFLSEPLARYIVAQQHEWIAASREVQEKWRTGLVQKAMNTQFGKDHFFKDIHSYVDFKSAVPVSDYEDLKGGLKLKEIYRESALAVFVKVSSEQEIIRRLSERGTETEKSLETRLGKVRYELSFEDKFDVTLVNDDLEETLKKAEKMVLEFIAS